MTTQADIDKGKSLIAKAITDNGIVQQDLNALQTWMATLTPCPDVPIPPQPGPTGTVASLGIHFRTVRGNWMGDFLDMAKAPPLNAIPFDCYSDKAKGILAPAQNGVTPSRYMEINPWGLATGRTPVLQNGKMIWYDPEHGDPVTQDNAPFQPPDKYIVSREGDRGACLILPYITWRGHQTLDATGNPIPRSPVAIGIAVDGTVYMQFVVPTASVAILGYITGLAANEGITDFAYNVPNRKIFYVAVQSRDGKGRIIKVDRTPAIAAKPPGAIEDWKLWTQTTLATGLGAITSIDTLEDGTLYACDNHTGALLTFNAAGTPTVVASILGIYWVRHTSKGQLIVLDQFSGLYCYSSTGALQTTIQPKQSTQIWPFGAIDVDVRGVAGEVDRIMQFDSHIDGAQGMRFFSGPNWSVRKGWDELGMSGQSYRRAGAAFWMGYPSHYPWIAFFAWDQGWMEFQGFGNINPTVIRVTIPGDPPVDNWNHGLFKHGYAVLMCGTTKGNEGTKPSLTCQMDPEGWSGIGLNCDYLLSLGWQGLADWVHAGGIGSFRRDEIVGYDLYALMYFFCGGSQALVHKGQALLDELRAFFPANMPATSPPIVPYADQSTEQWAHCITEVSGNMLKLVRATVPGGSDYQPITTPPPPDLVCRVIVDEGMPGQILVGDFSAANGWQLPTPSVASGQHLISCHVTSASPNHIGEASLWYAGG